MASSPWRTAGWTAPPSGCEGGAAGCCTQDATCLHRRAFWLWAGRRCPWGPIRFSFSPGIPGNYYNLHPGSHTGQGTETGIRQIAQALNAVLRPEQRTTVLLETMAGKGTELGGQFLELREIMDRVALPVGVCLDTCHVWDAGYDICGDLDGVLTEFDRVIGLDRLRAVHLNNSLNPCGSHKDRHAVLLGGAMPLEAIRRVVNHPALRGLPMVLETPNDLPGYAAEIRLLRQLAEEG